MNKPTLARWYFISSRLQNSTLTSLRTNSRVKNQLMAALRRIIGKSYILSSTKQLVPPALLVCHRGITTKLFVGGLSFYTTENGLSEAFSQYGQVVEAKIVTDRVSGRSKGFGFVTYAAEDDAQNALDEMNGKPLNGRVIFVDYAKPRTDIGGGMPIARGPPGPISES